MICLSEHKGLHAGKNALSVSCRTGIAFGAQAETGKIETRKWKPVTKGGGLNPEFRDWNWENIRNPPYSDW
jgi:hypothetical protein